ncbi:hypothetical protein MANES_09G125800v8 [Manihot esculenta]|uniref:Zinc finger C5HC2-type domain-containing protein n=1 Tax=Manihot esculenta TaxID=3983 RepID=A0A2C9VA87_MANES|nr:hypothetical protein MANES_09G125800v8 [Manihot esculenta]
MSGPFRCSLCLFSAFVNIAGFNCGEAVNFAIGDWFPFGELATKRYAHIGMMAILPREEILCKESAQLLKHEDLYRSSAGLASHNSLEISFVRHMRFFNNALWKLKNNVENSKESSILSSNTHGTIICGTCKRDSCLAFLECNKCFHLLCHFHDVKSLDCPCGGKSNLFIRENIRDMEELAQKLEEEGIMRKIQKETKCGNNVGLQPNAINFCKKSERIPDSKNDDLQRQESGATRTGESIKEMTATNARRKDDNGDSDVVKSHKSL